MRSSEIKPTGAEPVAEGVNLFRRVDVDVLDLQPTTGGLLQLVQRGAGGAADGRHDLGAAVDVLRCDGMAQTTRGAYEQYDFVL